MMRSLRCLALLLTVGLAACASGEGGSLSSGGTIECVPFARALTGIALRGDAPEWWASAEGRYKRGRTPAVGAILVFARTARLQHGHVSVVSRVLSSREILVTHANWVQGKVTRDDSVADVSPENDWSVVRVWWEPAGQLGVTLYPLYGFITPDRRLDHEAIAAATGRAAKIAISGGS